MSCVSLRIDCRVQTRHNSMPYLAFIATLLRVTDDNLYGTKTEMSHAYLKYVTRDVNDVLQNLVYL